MEDMDDILSNGSELLFIKEEDGEPDRTLEEQRECNAAQSGLNFTGVSLNPSALMKPYLQEMDDLLKSCEELTGIPFGSGFSESYAKTSMSRETHHQGKDEVKVESYTGMSLSPQAYLSTNYIDTHMDEAGTEDQPAQCQAQSMGPIINRCGVIPIVSRQTEMPLTSAGNKLSETMVKYEDQLMGMLAMLESCMAEAGMDFEPKDWAADTSHEYVHICKNRQVCRGTSVPILQERSEMLEAQPMQVESWAAQQAGEDNEDKDGGGEMIEHSVNHGSEQNPLLGCDNLSGFSVERVEKSENFKTDQGNLDPQFRFLGTAAQDEIQVDTTCFSSGMDELQDLGSQMEECIEEVRLLQKRRKELLAEVLELRGNDDRGDKEGRNEEEEETEEGINSKVAELMNILKKEEEARREERKREIQSLKKERAEEERRMWKVNMERQGLQDELRKLKRRLFTVARDCAHNQTILNTQHRAVELLKREEEKLQSLVVELTEDSCQLRSTQQKLLLELKAQLHAHSSSHMSNTQEELNECRRHSCGDIQQYLQGGLRTLENRYEPILLALLKRREATAGALVKAKEQAQELKAQLGPLKEEIQKLKLHRACLEEKLKLSHIHWREDIGHYKAMACRLEERSRELKTELQIQKKKTKETEELRDILAKQLLLYRDAIEDHKCDHEGKT